MQINCIDYNVSKRSGEEEEETALERLLRVEREHQAIEEEERRVAMEAKRAEKVKLLEIRRKSSRCTSVTIFNETWRAFVSI